MHSGKRRRTLLLTIATAIVALTIAAIATSRPQEQLDAAAPEGDGLAGALALTVHSPIFINTDFGFTNASGVVWGAGTESDPYVIEGWDINASTANGIQLWNTRAHFVVRDCFLHGGYPGYLGVYLYNCTNGTVIGNVCSNNSWGMYLYLAYDNTLSGNNCSGNDEAGIRTYDSWRNSILNNTCTDEQYGILLFYPSNFTVRGNNCSADTIVGLYAQSSDNSTFENNTLRLNGQDGMTIGYSRNSTVTGNTCDGNIRNGVRLYSSENILVFNNSISNNTGYGLQASGLADSVDNWIWNNTFYHNNQGGDVYSPLHIQGFDDGTANHWNSTDGFGNFWSDWTAPDIDGDGIVDVPYDIAGGLGVQDSFPQTTVQTPIPEFGAAIVPIMLLAIAMMALRAGRARTR